MGNLPKLTVEPVMFLCFAGLYYYQLVRDTGIYRQLCVEKFSSNKNSTDSSTICRTMSSNFSSSESKSSDSEEDSIQKRATLIIMILSLAVITPAMISDLILSALSDRFGRKVIILIGIGGTLVSILPLIAYFTFPDTVPLYGVFAGNLVAGVSGSLAIVLVGCYAFLSDTTSDRNTLTVRMALLSVSMTTGQTFGTYLGGKLLMQYSAAQCALGAVVIQCLAFFYCLIFIPNTKPVLFIDGEEAKSVLQHHQNDILTRNGQRQRSNSYVKSSSPIYALHLLKSTLRTFFKRRQNFKRCFLIICLLVFFINTFTDYNSSSVLTLFVYHRPLRWSPDQFGTWKAVDSIVVSAGNVIGVLILKKCLRVSDPILTILGLFSACTNRVLIGTSQSTLNMYVASAVGALGRLSQPAVASFASQMVDDHEVGKLFGGIALSAQAALVAAALVFSTIYTLTVDAWPGCAFFAMAGFCTVAMAFILWVVAKIRTLQAKEEATERRNPLL